VPSQGNSISLSTCIDGRGNSVAALKPFSESPFDPTSSNCIALLKNGLLCISCSYGSASLASQDLKIEMDSSPLLVPLLGDEKSIDVEDVRDKLSFINDIDSQTYRRRKVRIGEYTALVFLLLRLGLFGIKGFEN
jgi:hypothetical protein